MNHAMGREWESDEMTSECREEGGQMLTWERVESPSCRAMRFGLIVQRNPCALPSHTVLASSEKAATGSVRELTLD